MVCSSRTRSRPAARNRPEHLSVVVDRVAINPDIDDERFKMPRAER